MNDKVPDEVFVKILGFCDVRTLCSFGLSCKHSYRTLTQDSNDEPIWMPRVKCLMENQNYQKRPSLSWKKELEFLKTFPPTSFTDSSKVPLNNETFFGPDKFKYFDVATETLPVCSVDALYILFSQDSRSEKVYHDERGDTNMVVEPWQKASDGVGLFRNLEFISPVNNPMGPKTTLVKNAQRLVIFSDAKSFMVQINTKTVDVPYGDCFCMQVEIVIKDNSDGVTCNMSIMCGVIFLKSTFFRWKIEEVAGKESLKNWQVWSQKALSACQTEKSEQNLFSCSGSLLSEDSPSSRGVRSNSGATKSTLKKKKTKHNKKTSFDVAPVIVHSPVKQHAPTPLATPKRSPLTSHVQPPQDQSLLSTVLSWFLQMFGSVNAPLWSLLLFLILFLLIMMPQQMLIGSNLYDLENTLREYKIQDSMSTHNLIKMY
ncbi:GRAM domain-containing protein [Acrasis kona]|uniref:GRAM domain-containing protein n=1 Tax=Acrasis kona TaxID=1008807 RepID=A0AAW2YS40_9EUKA